MENLFKDKRDIDKRWIAMAASDSPVRAAHRKRMRLIAVLGVVGVLLLFIITTSGISTLYIKHLTGATAIQESEDTAVSLNKLLIGPSEDIALSILGGKQLFTTMATDDTRTYSFEDTPCMIIISRIATDVTLDNVSETINQQLGNTQGEAEEMHFPDANIMSQFPGYYYQNESQKMLIGYLLNTDGYLYSITYISSLEMYNDYESKAMSLINQCKFKNAF